MQPVYLSIQQKATGERIRELLKKNGLIFGTDLSVIPCNSMYD